MMMMKIISSDLISPALFFKQKFGKLTSGLLGVCSQGRINFTFIWRDNYAALH
jgi:hypothetical protein